MCYILNKLLKSYYNKNRTKKISPFLSVFGYFLKETHFNLYFLSILKGKESEIFSDLKEIMKKILVQLPNSNFIEEYFCPLSIKAKVLTTMV